MTKNIIKQGYLRDNKAQAERTQLISLVYGANNTFLKLCGQPNELRNYNFKSCAHSFEVDSPMHSLFVALCPSLYLYVSLPLSFCLSSYVSVYLSVSFSLCLTQSLSLCLSQCLSLCIIFLLSLLLCFCLYFSSCLSLS